VKTSSFRRSLTWHGLAIWAAIATTAVNLVTAVATETYLLLISVLLFGIGAVLTWRSNRAGPIMLMILSLLYLLFNGPFLVPYVVAPASWLNFILTTLVLVACVVTLIAATAARRRREEQSSAAPATVASIAIVLGVLCVVVGVVAGIAYQSPSPEEGDVRLSTSNFEFSTARLQASPGEVPVFVTNEDSVLHTFTIESLDVNLNVPANSTARVTFQADAGSYRYVCTLHSNMRGTLLVR
jgi:plastocyanin